MSISNIIDKGSTIIDSGIKVGSKDVEIEQDEIIKTNPTTPPEDPIPFDPSEPINPDILDKGEIERPISPEVTTYDPDMHYLRYVGYFRDTNDVLCTVKFLKKGYIGESEELLLADNPVTINFNADSIFKPIKYSGCSINVLTNKIVELYTGKITDIRVEIYRGPDLLWQGFVSPNIYNQEYYSELDSMTIEAIDCLSVLKYIDFDMGYDFRAFTHTLKYIFNKLPLEKNYKILYTNSLDNNNEKLLRDIYHYTRNWYDEDETPMKCNEVLEHIARFLGCQIVQQGSIFYILDVIKYCHPVNMTFRQYEKDVDDWSSFDFTPILYEAEVAENNAQISYGDVYNNINVIASLNTYDSVIDLFENEGEQLSNVSGYEVILDNTKHELQGGSRNYVCFLDKPKGWTGDVFTLNVDQLINPTVIQKGGVFVKEGFCTPDYIDYGQTGGYDFEFNGQPTSLSMETYYTYKISSQKRWENTSVSNYKENLINTPSGNKILSYTTDLINANAGDYLFITFKCKPSKRLRSRDNFAVYNSKSYSDDDEMNVYDLTEHHPKQTSKFKNLLALHFRIKFGSDYFGHYPTEKVTSFGYRTMEFWAETQKKFVDTGGFYGQVYDSGSWEGEWNCVNNNTYKENLEDDESGLIIRIPTDISEKLTLELYDDILRPVKAGEENNVSYTDYQDFDYMVLTDLKVKILSKNNKSFFEGKKEEEDIKYSVDIDDDFVSEAEDITLYLNTYNDNYKNVKSYSHICNALGQYKILFEKNGETLRPEEHIVTSMAKYYSKPRLIYTNTFKDIGFEGIDMIKIPCFPDKMFTIGNSEYNIKYNTITASCYEID